MTMLWTWGCTPPADLPVGVLRVECNALFAIPVEQKPCLLQGRHPCQIARKLGEYVNVFHCLQIVWRTKRLRSSSHTRMFSSKCSNSKLHIFRSSSMPSFWWCFCVVATSSPCNCIGTIVDKCFVDINLVLDQPRCSFRLLIQPSLIHGMHKDVIWVLIVVANIIKRCQDLLLDFRPECSISSEFCNHNRTSLWCPSPSRILGLQHQIGE